MKLLEGYAIGKVKGKKEYFLYEGDCACCGVFTGLIAECKSEKIAIQVFNDHIPLLDGCILQEPLLIKISK
jgi:hypothetical protein